MRVKVYATSRRVKVCATVDVNHLLKSVSGVSRVAIGRADTVGVTSRTCNLPHGRPTVLISVNRIGLNRAMEWLDRFWRNLPT